MDASSMGKMERKKRLSAVLHANIKTLDLKAFHRAAKTFRDAREDLWVLVMGGGFHYRLRIRPRVFRFEDAGAHEYAVNPKLHHQSGVGRRCYPSCGEVHHGKPPKFFYLKNKFDGNAHLLCCFAQSGRAHGPQSADLGSDSFRVPHRLDDVSGSRL